MIILKEVHNMAYTINDSCINCGACIEECPTEAISAGADAHVIDAEKCIDCGACAGACPVDAPVEG
jgi:ferredoxin